MKQGNSVITLVMVLLALALTGYLGMYIWDNFHTPYTTTVAYAYTNYDSVELDGLLVREELVLPDHSGIVDLVRHEGEKVAVGSRVAMVYRDGTAQAAQDQQEALSQEMEVLEYAIRQSGDVASTARLDEDILQSLVALRSSCGLSDFTRLEQQVLEIKSSVVKRDFTYGTGVTAEDLKARHNQLAEQLSALTARTAGSITRVTAPQSGVFSSLVDGCEDIKPQQLMTLDLDGLTALISGAAPASQSLGLGKLIVSDRWYFAASVDPDSAQRLSPGKTVPVRFSGDFTQEVDMQVERVECDGDRAVLVLSSDRCLAQTTLLRRQTAELVFDRSHGVRIPKKALRMEQRTVPLPDSSLTEEKDVLGVYAIVSGKAVFKEVEIVSEGSDFYVVRSVTQGKHALRPGDDIVLRGTGLFSGKLMEY